MKRIVLILLLPILAIAQSHTYIFDTSKKGSAVTLNGSNQYMPATPSLKLTGKYSLTDDFSDGNYDGWTVASGTFAVNNSAANPLSTNQYSLVCSSDGIISIPCNQAYGIWEFDLYRVNNSISLIITFIASNLGNRTSQSGAYYLGLGTSNQTGLGKTTGGSYSSMFSSATSYLSLNTWYRVRIVRTNSNVFYYYIKGGAFGNTYSLVSTSGGSGTNPTTDATYNYSNYFNIEFLTGDRISNIVCEYGEGSLDLSGFERIKLSQNRDFETSGITWTGAGNHSIERSNTDKKTGSYSGKITSTGVGNSSTDYVMLPYTSFTPLGTDANGIYEKYTLEFWCRAVNQSDTKITAQIGNQSKQSGNISQTAGLTTKFVFNFQATASEINQGIKLYANQADEIYIDDVSLTKRFDRTKNFWFKTSTTGTKKQIAGRLASSKGIELYVNTSNKLEARIGDGTNVVTVTGSATVTDDNWHLAGLLVNSTGNAQLYLDGNTDGSAVSVANIGSIIHTTALGVGFNSSDYFNGQIGEGKLDRLTDVTLSNFATSQMSMYKLGILRTLIGGSPEEVARYKFTGSTTTDMLKDWSGSGNDLSGVNVSISNQTKANYPMR